MKTRREAMVVFGGAGLVVSQGNAWGRPQTMGAKGALPDGLRRSPPHIVGVDADAVLAFLDDARAKNLELDSFMIYRNGSVAAEGWWWPYKPAYVHMLHSATKSFTGTGVGIAIGEGKLSLSDPVLKFFPGRVPRPSDNLQAMTVESLLTQTSGDAVGVSGSEWRPIKTSWVDEFFKIPVTYKPNTHFVYSSATSFMLSAIMNQATGQSIFEYMKPRFFDPIGAKSARWDVGPENINPGGNGLSTTTSDFLKLGVIYMAGGKWRERQVVPANWAAEAVTPKFGYPYGYQWWVSKDDLGYSADGKFGQFCFVFPKLDAVLVTTAGVPDNAATRDLMHALAFDHVPKMCGLKPEQPRSSSDLALAQRIESLRILPPFVPQSSPLAAKVSGQTYACTANADAVRSLKLDFSGDVCRFTMTDNRGSHVVVNGLNDWREGETTITGGYLHHEYEPDVMRVVAGGRWSSPSQLTFTWQFVESGFRDTVTLTFEGDTVRFDRGVNVNSGPLQRPTIEGRRSSSAV